MSSSISVAPYAGAWIEISSVCFTFIVTPVAPYAGAWIEIYYRPQGAEPLKVAPYAGAWIEIRAEYVSVLPSPSLLMQERGLKSVFLDNSCTPPKSLLMQERGLKYL